VRAGRARRDAEGLSDLLVRAPRGDEAHDLQLAAREPGHTRRDGAHGRSSTQFSNLLARRVELRLGAEVGEDLVRAPQLANRALAIARHRQRARELTPGPRSVGDVGYRLERVHRIPDQRDGARCVALQHLHQRVAGVGPGEPQPLSEQRRIAA
jgi:hypothetical protein